MQITIGSRRLPSTARLARAVIAASGVLAVGTTASHVSYAATPDAAAVSYTIFGSATPAHPQDPDTATVTLGVVFSSAISGSISGVRFFKAAGNTGTHVASLYNSSGTRLARATVTAESASGWQEVDFASPVAVVAGKNYTAAYLAPAGHYAGDNGYFSSPKVSGDLTARKGVYKYADGFPSSTWKSSNYYVDVVFSPGSTPASSSSTTSASSTTTASSSTSSTSSSSSSTTSASSSSTTSASSTSSSSTTSSSSSSSTGTDTNCASQPSRCGYPDATNTGVQQGITLRRVPQDVTSGPGWHLDPRGWVEVDGDGAVIENLLIPYNLDISADNVTVRNVRVIQSNDSFGISVRHTHGVTISDSEVYSPDDGQGRLLVGIKDIYADSVNLLVQRNNIWHTSTGIQMDAGTITDNYVHDLGYRAGDHTNGTTSNGGTETLIIRHNTIFNHKPQTDAISLFEDFGVQANKTIDNNLLAGGGYSIYGGQNPGGATSTHVTITNNRISRHLYPNGGSYGPITAYNPNATGNTWTGNTWDDTGSPVAAG